MIRIRGRFRCQRIIYSWLPAGDRGGSSAGCDLFIMSRYAKYSTISSWKMHTAYKDMRRKERSLKKGHNQITKSANDTSLCWCINVMTLVRSYSAAEMTYILSGGALNSTHSHSVRSYCCSVADNSALCSVWSHFRLRCCLCFIGRQEFGLFFSCCWRINVDEMWQPRPFLCADAFLAWAADEWVNTLWTPV